MKFVAIDVETANSDMTSICQIGLAKFEHGKIVAEWSALIDPEDYFDGINIGVHGITENDVLGCPTFVEIADELAGFLNNEICVCHTHFDRVSIGKAVAKHGLEGFTSSWLDSAMVTRRTWEDCAKRGYGLASICAKIGYVFEHHDALEDAKAAGHVLLAAIETSGVDLNTWVKQLKRPTAQSRLVSLQ